MDINTVHETPDNDKNFDLDEYILPTSDALPEDGRAATADPFCDDISNDHVKSM